MVRESTGTINRTIDVMELDKLRQTIIDRLKDVNDPDDLGRLLYIVEHMILSSFDPGNVTQAQMRIFNDAIDAVKRGEFFTLEEEIRDIDKWIEEN